MKERPLRRSTASSLFRLVMRWYVDKHVSSLKLSPLLLEEDKNRD